MWTEVLDSGLVVDGWTCADRNPDSRVRRDDPRGTPVIIFDKPVAVVVTVDGGSWPGFAEQWRGRWVYATWSCGVGLQHLGWLLSKDVARV